MQLLFKQYEAPDDGREAFPSGAEPQDPEQDIPFEEEAPEAVPIEPEPDDAVPEEADLPFEDEEPIEAGPEDAPEPAEETALTESSEADAPAARKAKKPPEVILDDEDDILIYQGEESEMDGKKKKKKKKTASEKWEKVKSIWRKLSPGLALICAVLLTYVIIRMGVNFAVRKFLRPVDANDPTPIVVEIPKSSGASAIAKILYEAGGEGEKGLIQNKSVFKVYVDFLGKSSGLKAGTYVLSRNMGMDQIIDIICSGNPPRATVKFTISEGMTVEAVAKRLVDKGILASSDRFLELCTDAKSFANKYWFVKNIVEEGREGRTYMLEGYLFPDTYEVFENASEEEIIQKMLDRFNEIYSRRYVERAEELDMTMDDVVILASIIEREAKTFDFNKVSAVFHGRMAQNLPLHSDATLNYILKSDKMVFDQTDLDTDSPYNTYKYYGLPAGPISNPGVAAIEAALFPNEQYMREGYLYFCLMDSTTGALAFAKTEAEHAANVEKYRPNW